MRDDLPSGTVTFLFTDVEGSTRLLHELGAEEYAEALAEHRRVIREACARHHGAEVDTQGDAFFFAFPSAPRALLAASEMTKGLASGRIQVRIGLHTGKPLLTEDGYVGDDVHLGARVAASAHGGQILLSAQTAAAIAPSNSLLQGASLIDLGEHRLKDIAGAVSIRQLGEGSFPPLKTISNTNLPRPASSFLGRERELEHVLAKIDGGARLLTLTGPGGTGKTRLALEAAATLVPSYKGGVFWVGLASLRDSALVAETIAQTLGAKDGLAAFIAEREMLLLLDNLEQVIEVAPELSSLLQECPNVTLLVTSRELLRVQGEVEYPVPPLAEPEAVALFCERSQVEPSGEIAELCARLDSLPLAVELAAARTRALSVSQILERLSQRLDLLKGGRDADPRQQTLRATIEWSYDLLSLGEQALFARLSVFAGGCTLEAAGQVAGADLDLQQALVEKNLLSFSNERYWMLETIREFAGEQLDEEGEADACMERLAGHLVALANAYGAPFFREDTANTLERLDLEHANVRVVMDWAHQAQRPRYAAELFATWMTVWLSRSHTAEAAGWVDLALGARGDVPDDMWPRVLAGSEQMLIFGSGDFDRARALMEEALDVLARLEGQAYWEAGVMSELSAISLQQGLLEEARDWAERSLALRVEQGVVQTRALADLASLALREDDLDRAEELLIQVRHIFASEGPARSVAVASRLLGEVERRRENLVAAAQHVQAALRRFADLGDEVGVGECLEDLARLAKSQGNLGHAARLWSMGHALWSAGGAPVRSPHYPEGIGELPELDSFTPVGFSVEEAVAFALDPEG